MRSIGKSAFLYAALATALSAPVHADLLRVESQTLFSSRKNVSQKTELPFYEFVSGNYVTDGSSLECNVNFGIFEEPIRPTNDVNLYLLDVAYQPKLIPIRIRAGRSFNTHSLTHTTTTDSGGIDYSLFDSRLTVGALGGLERKFSDTTNDTVSFGGGHVTYKGADMFPLTLATKYLLRAPTAATKQHIVGLSVHQPLEFSWSPELLGSVEYYVNAKRLNFAEVGFDLYPTYRLALRWRGLTYESKPEDEPESPIYSLFASGRLYETSVQAEYQFTGSLSSSLATGYDNYAYQDTDRTQGYRVAWGVQFKQPNWTLDHSAYYFRSYGGFAYGDRVGLTIPLTDRFELSGLSDVTYYKKITSAKRAAFNFEGWLKTWLWSDFRLNTGVELNSNNLLKYDFRAAIKLTYLLWKDV